MAIIENNVLMKYKDSSGNVNLLYPITLKDNVDGIDEAVRNQGVVTEGTGSVYTATVEGITSLSAGVSFVMIPHVESTTSSPKLNVNNLGENLIRRRVSNCTGTFYNATAPSDWLTAGKPIAVTYDGQYWIADMPVPNANDIMGAVAIGHGGTGATTAAQARINLGIETTDGTVSSGNADYAEVEEWFDGNPDAEDRIGYFVCIDNTTSGITMRKATSSDDIRGVTVISPAFAGGCSSDKYATVEAPGDSDPDADARAGLLPQYAYVAVMGIVPVIDDGTCVVNGRCMPNDSGIATAVEGDYGYQVIERVDDTHIIVAVEPGTDYQHKFKNYVDNKRFLRTATITTNWTGDTAPYTQDVSVEGVLETDQPHITPVYSSTLGTALLEKEAWSMVSKAETSDGSITFTCFEDKPSTEIFIQIEVMR